ncbi:hypothetical protein QG057_09850, partial [Kingella kingae]|nr:hypothetical protein [Kingella kingae]
MLAAAEQQAKQAQETPKEPPKQEEHFIAKLPNDKLMTMYRLFQKQLDELCRLLVVAGFSARNATPARPF